MWLRGRARGRSGAGSDRSAWCPPPAAGCQDFAEPLALCLADEVIDRTARGKARRHAGAAGWTGRKPYDAVDRQDRDAVGGAFDEAAIVALFCRNAASACLRSVMSRAMARTRTTPSSVMGLRLTSTAVSAPARSRITHSNSLSSGVVAASRTSRNPSSLSYGKWLRVKSPIAIRRSSSTLQPYTSQALRLA